MRFVKVKQVNMVVSMSVWCVSPNDVTLLIRI